MIFNFLGLILVMCLLVLTSQKERECPRVDGYVDCYVCTSAADSEDDYCGDPFNGASGHANITKAYCHGYCTKWVRETVSGSTRITRMCSASLTMSMQKATVCMHERQSSRGILCFCNEDLCNTAMSVFTPPYSFILVLSSYFISLAL